MGRLVIRVLGDGVKFGGKSLLSLLYTLAGRAEG